LIRVSFSSKLDNPLFCFEIKKKVELKMAGQRGSDAGEVR